MGFDCIPPKPEFGTPPPRGGEGQPQQSAAAFRFRVIYNDKIIRYADVPGGKTKVECLYDYATSGPTSDEELMDDICLQLEAGPPYAGLLGSYLILWVREMGEADFKRILTERREGVAIISGTPDDFEISYGATIPG